MTVQTVFEYLPGKKKYKQQYPELYEIDEFKVLNQPDLIFAWYVGYEYSPYNYPKKQTLRNRVVLAIQQAYGEDDSKLSHQKRREYVEGHFPENIKNAIDRMATVNTNVRIQAKETTEKAFENLKRISEVSMSDLNGDDGSIDLDKAAKYSKTVMDIIDKMPGLITRVETGYSVTKIAKGHIFDSAGKSTGMNVADQVLTEE